MTNKSKVDDKKYPKYFEDFMELTDFHKTSGVSSGQITDTLTFFTKLESAILAEKQDVARRAIEMAREKHKIEGIDWDGGYRMGLKYTPEQILAELNLSDKEQKE